MRKYKIGITFNLEAEVADIWANGANQNVVHLYELFKYSEIVEDVFLVSWGPENRTSPPPGFMLDGLDIQYALFDDIADQLDVLIEGTLSIEPDKIDRLHARGAKTVCYKMGNDFIMDMQKFLFDRPTGRLFNGAQFDAVWMIPQHENTCHSYFSIMNRCESFVVPAIWSPVFCDQVIKRLKEQHNLEFGYRPGAGAKRIASFEANMDVVKTSFTPILICEQAYRESPELIKHVYMCNTYDKRDNPTFFNFIGRTDLVRSGVMTVEGRYQMPDFLARYVDVVLSHQWENGLNYAYNDALYGGYPFIHNSRLLPKGVGYYYSEFDAFEGARVLLDVIKNHDAHHEAYVKRANDYLNSLLPTNKINILCYERELLRLFE
ncbi:DUF2827 family protein [Haemophilus pittmaniae]|uniref:DUF2827 family protein n=1 Tax=Haemophilus pittmaniae TaxID=249188 RepID=UPI0028DB03CB|nr:DUF2827 family protein [Haemophilus pittmaniae]